MARDNDPRSRLQARLFLGLLGWDIHAESDAALLPSQRHHRRVGAGRLDGIAQIFLMRPVSRLGSKAQRIEPRIVVEGTPLPRHTIKDDSPFRFPWNGEERIGPGR